MGKTGAYLHFLGILSRMLIRLMEVDIYDEEDINCSQYTSNNRTKKYVKENTRHAISYRSLSHYLAGVGPLGPQVEGVQRHPSNASWPSIDIMRTMPFDYSIHDPRYDDVSPVYSPGYKPSAEGTKNFKHHLTSAQTGNNVYTFHLFSPVKILCGCILKQMQFVKRMCTCAGERPG